VIDRRQLLTGLATVAATGVAPALPASAAPLVEARASCTGIVYRSLLGPSFRVSPLQQLIWRFRKTQTWLYQGFGGDLEFVVCHPPTGLMFISSPTPERSGDPLADTATLVEFIASRSVGDLSPAALTLIGQSAHGIAMSLRGGARVHRYYHGPQSDMTDTTRAYYLWFVPDRYGHLPPDIATKPAPQPLLAEGFSREDMRLYL
jgi:hypothetical protein